MSFFYSLNNFAECFSQAGSQSDVPFSLTRTDNQNFPQNDHPHFQVCVVSLCLNVQDYLSAHLQM